MYNMHEKIALAVLSHIHHIYSMCYIFATKYPLIGYICICILNKDNYYYYSMKSPIQFNKCTYVYYF